jgi:hypothetical protein
MFSSGRTIAGLVLLPIALHLPLLVKAYIPAGTAQSFRTADDEVLTVLFAVPTNDTSSLDSSDDLLHLAFSAGVYKCVFLAFILSSSG